MVLNLNGSLFRRFSYISGNVKLWKFLRHSQGFTKDKLIILPGIKTNPKIFIKGKT